MASNQLRFLDKRYRNWLTGTLSLLYVKEGIENLVDAEAVVFHTSLLRHLNRQGITPQICSSCTAKSMKKDVHRQVWKMHCGLCNPWLQQIVQHHNYPLKLTPANTNPQLWTTDPYEVCKAYMPYGCAGNQSAKDGDVQGVLSLIKNCCHFTTCIGQSHLIDKLLEFRNSLFHSGNFLVDDTALQAAQQTMLAFLQGMTSLSTPEQQSVEQAVDKITELQKGTLDFSLNRELELRALQSQQNSLDSEQTRLKHKFEKFQTDSDISKTKLKEVDSDVKTLQRDVASLTTKATTTESDLESQAVKMEDVEQRLERLQAVQDSLNRFLQVNNLEQDMRRLSTTLEHHKHRIENLTTHTQHLDVTTEKQEGEIATLYQRQEDTNTELQERLTDSQAHKFQLQAHSTMLASHHCRLEHVEERLQNPTGREASEMTDETITALRASLIKHYRDNSIHVKIPVVGQELAIEDIYVVPEIKVLREADKPRGVLSTVQNPKSTRNTSICQQIFYTKAYNNKHIYTTADAGMGKTTFCKYLVNLWCEAHDESRSNSRESQSDSHESQSDSLESWFANLTQSKSYPQGQKTRAKEEDKKIMSSFKLLFYITLRDSAKLYKLDEMIDSQILQSSRKTRSLKASDVLQTEGCLVIIDGLDEWACPEGVEVPHYVNPGIPGKQDFNSNTVFLTTTRPWKYEVLNLSNKDVDKYAELVGFDSKSADDLCFKLFKVMNKAESVKKDVQTFEDDIQNKGLSHLCNIPVILTVLVCLWFDKQYLGKSRVQLYCSMLEMLLKRADKNLPKKTSASMSETSLEEMPECLLKHKHCQDHCVLLFRLCEVAFEALFNQKREQALVFESSQMGILGVDQNDVDLCLKSGILSQSKVLGKWSVSEKKLSFLHKNLQEFLAAVFITCRNDESITSRVKQFCTSVESMLEMSQVLMFLSGINCDLAKQLFTDLITGVALKDSRLQQYRQTLENSALAQSIQTCILECVEEATCNGHNDLCLPLGDFVINKQTISTCLERLLTFNTAAIKSVRIDTDGMKPDAVERVMCQLQDTQCLQKLHLVDPSSVITTMQPLHLVDPSSVITTMQPLCKTLDNNKDSLTCLQLWYITLTTELYDAVCRALTHVTALGLWGVRLTHKQIEQLLLSVSQAQHIRQLKLVLYCTDHGDQCRAGIDVSGLTQLRTLYLENMYIARLPVMTDCLELVLLLRVTISESQLRQFIHALSSTSNLLKVKLLHVTVTGNSAKPPNLTDLQHNPKLVVTQCQYDDSYNTWRIEFHTKQQTTTASGWSGFAGQDVTMRTTMDTDAAQDIGDLEEAVSSEYEDQILTLLQQKNVPDRSCVQRVYDLFRKNMIQKSTFDRFLTKVYTYIKTISNKIIFVTACFDEQTPDEIVFIVVATERLQLDTPYNTKFRLQDEYNDEAAFVTCHEKCRNKSLTSQEAKYTADILQKQADNIMNKHSNVQMISACSVRSRNFGTAQHTIEEETCIVIYVSVKGFIPVHEKVLPKTLQIDGTQFKFPVDVREGGMILFATAKDYHKDIKMGCLITGKKSYGTVGAFTDKGKKTYCLTCAHIFTDNCNLLEKLQKNGIYKHNDDYEQGYEVNAYQNVAKDPKFKFGEVSFAVVKKGDGMLPGVDLAVVEISDDQRKPLEGYFPDDDVSSLGYGPDVPMIFRSGMYYKDKDSLSQQVKKTSEVFKHGCETAFTKGSLMLEEGYARQTEYQGVFEELQIRLDAQLVVGSIVDDETFKRFAWKGDSGAFVFAKHDGNQADLRAIGMVVGGNSFGGVFVTPIWGILHFLGENEFCGLKIFEERMDCSN